VHFTVDGNSLATMAMANGTGTWTFTPAGLADGSHTVVASEIDAAGNAGSATLSFILDTTPPAVTLTLATDTGSSATDKITSNATLTGSGDPNAIVHFTVDGNFLATTATANGSGAWTFTPAGLADGSHTVVASETDAAGNTGSASLSFTLDTTAPPVMVSLATDTGSSVTDKITSNATLTGSGDPNAIVHFTVDGNSLATMAMANGTGTWTFTPAGLADGAHTVVASETDAAGNIGSASLSFTLDTTAPQVTSLSAIAVGNVSALLAGDVLTITVATSEAVFITGVPTLQLNDNGVATYLSGSDTTALIFEYPVQSRDKVADLQVTGCDLPSEASIHDAAGNDLGLVSGDLGFAVGHTAPAPVAVRDAYVVLQGESVTTTAVDSVLFNDTGLVSFASLLSGPAHGSLQLAADGSFNYTPITFTGIDSFAYAANNPAGSNEAQALIYVVPVNGSGPGATLGLHGLTAEEQIAAIYTAFFSRGADKTGFEFWVNLFNQYYDNLGPLRLFSNIASSFGVSPEAQGLYPFLANPQGASDAQIGTFLNSVYQNLFNRDGDSAGLAYWTGQIKQAMGQGQFVGSVLVNIIAGAQNNAAGQDIITLMNKVAVGLEYVRQQEALSTSWSFADDGASGAALIHAVTSDPATVLVGIKQADALIHADVH
jgi:hypothetical protein